MNKATLLYYNDSSIGTLNNYLDVFAIVGITADDLLDYEYEEGKKNRDRIFEAYSPEEKQKMNSQAGRTVTADDLDGDTPLPIGCSFWIQCQYVTRDLVVDQSAWQEGNDDLWGWLSDFISDYVTDDAYTPVVGSATRAVPRCSVWGWFKTLYDNQVGLLDNLRRSGTGTFTDISDYIINLQTSVGAQGGQFSFTLPILPYPFSEMAVETAEGNEESMTDVFTNTHPAAGGTVQWTPRAGRHNYYTRVPLNGLGGFGGANNDYFSWLISNNDLIFIAFETLQIEQTRGERIFDMIGLVDGVTVSVNANGGGSVTVSGRDLMKLLSDDSSLFFNLSSAGGEFNGIFGNTESAGAQGDIATSVLFKEGVANSSGRLRWMNNELDIFATPRDRSIGFILKGVVSQLANIEIVPDYVFEAWGDRRTRYADLLSYEDEEEGNDPELMNDKADDYTDTNTEFADDVIV